MRTPGCDEDLVLGFLFTEGIIGGPAEVARMAHCEAVKEEERGNVIRAELHPALALDPARWQRNFYATSSCGVCGKSSIEAVKAHCVRPLRPMEFTDPASIIALPDRMRAAQAVFGRTGGIHAAALFTAAGELLLLREDVGRHNAVDKVIGAALRFGRLMQAAMLLVSGRAGFELVQKCVVAG
ncbi:MAG: formate dehydrogenase accessory sulfurtransferase FdhD, partial [Flavobacteriales bacterium]